MALTRPPMTACGMAALGPQLHLLAASIDQEAVNLQTDRIFTGLNVQSALIVRSNAVAQVIPGSGASANMTWDAEEYRIGNALQFTGGNINIGNTEFHRHWYYLGFYTRTTGSGANVDWRMGIDIDDFDPITAVSSNIFFTKTFTNTNAATAEELLWIETFFRSGGGIVQTNIAQNSGGNITVGGGRWFAMQLSSQR